MKLKHRFSLYTVSLFSVITLVISVVIYVAFYTKMKQNESHVLESKALLAAIYYLEKDEVSLNEHDSIGSRLRRTISRKDVVVFDEANRIFDGEMEAVSPISIAFLKEVRTKLTAEFTTESHAYYGVFYQDNQGDFVVVARESTQEFDKQMQSLLQIILLVSFAGLLIIFLSTQFLATFFYDPILRIISQMNDRDPKNFHQPLQPDASYAEINELIATYNRLMQTLGQNFIIQKNFIDYVSHELRTPIAAIRGTLDVTGARSRTAEEHELVIEKLRLYVNDLQETLEQMMLLSGAKTSYEQKQFRIDEVVWRVMESQIRVNQAAFKLDWSVENTALFVLHGNEKLMELAIQNILSNAVKYSNQQEVLVSLQENKGRLVLCIQDQGIGILAADLPHITEHFYRGSNTSEFQGKGIGLSISKIVLEMHNIELKIDSNATGTRITLQF